LKMRAVGRGFERVLCERTRRHTKAKLLGATKSDRFRLKQATFALGEVPFENGKKLAKLPPGSLFHIEQLLRKAGKGRRLLVIRTGVPFRIVEFDEISSGLTFYDYYESFWFITDIMIFKQHSPNFLSSPVPFSPSSFYYFMTVVDDYATYFISCWVSVIFFFEFSDGYIVSPKRL
jgi:hypothetical protein